MFSPGILGSWKAGFPHLPLVAFLGTSVLLSVSCPSIQFFVLISQTGERRETGINQWVVIAVALPDSIPQHESLELKCRVTGPHWDKCSFVWTKASFAFLGFGLDGTSWLLSVGLLRNKWDLGSPWLNCLPSSLGWHGQCCCYGRESHWPDLLFSHSPNAEKTNGFWIPKDSLISMLETSNNGISSLLYTLLRYKCPNHSLFCPGWSFPLDINHRIPKIPTLFLPCYSIGL